MNEKIATPNAPHAIGPYSQAIRYGDFLFVSGQIAIDPQTADIIEGDIEAQTEQVLKNITAIIEAAGMSLQCPTRCTTAPGRKTSLASARPTRVAATSSTATGRLWRWVRFIDPSRDPRPQSKYTRRQRSGVFRAPKTPGWPDRMQRRARPRGCGRRGR